MDDGLIAEPTARSRARPPAAPDGEAEVAAAVARPELADGRGAVLRGPVLSRASSSAGDIGRRGRRGRVLPRISICTSHAWQIVFWQRGIASMAWHVAPSRRDVARDANAANNAKRIKGRRKSTQTLRTRMDSGPHSSMQSGPATGGTSHRGRGSRVVLARVDPNRSAWGKAQPTGCGRAWRPLARRVGHDCAQRTLFPRLLTQSKEGHVRAAKMRRAAALLPREWWNGWTRAPAAGVLHADHLLSAVQMFLA